MSRKMVLGMSVAIWAVMDLMFNDSLKPLIGQTIFAGTVLWVHWSSNK